MHALAIALVATLALASSAGYAVLQTLRSANELQRVQLDRALLDQAAYALAAEADTAGSYPVALAPQAASPAPTGGGRIPAASKAPKADAIGQSMGYCTYAAASAGDTVFAVIAPGPDRSFATSCGQALAGTPQGDDLAVSRIASQIVMGVGSSLYWREPVPNDAVLASIPVPQDGELRLVLSSTGSKPALMYWDGAAWAPACAQP